MDEVAQARVLPPSLAVDEKHEAGCDFRTGKATECFIDIDRHVTWRLKRLRIKRKGRHLGPGEARCWHPTYLRAPGLHHLGGAIAYPEAA